MRRDFLEAKTIHVMWEVAEREAHRIGRVLEANLNVSFEQEESGFKLAYLWYKNVAEGLKCQEVEEIIKKINTARSCKIKEWVDAVD